MSNYFNAGNFATLLGITGAILVPLTHNCTFGPQVCSVITAIASGISLVLGATHSGAGLEPSKNSDPPPTQ